MARFTDDDLYRRGAETLLASWEAIARGSRAAAVLRLRGVAAAVFPREPERGVYNNAVLHRGLDTVERTRAVERMHGGRVRVGRDRPLRRLGP